MTYQPRWFQGEAVQSIFDYYANPAMTSPMLDGSIRKADPLIVMPTGTGKSLVIAFLIQRMLWQFRNTRFIVAAHVKNLLSQNAEKLENIWPHAPYGIHSDGLGARDVSQPIIFGGVASMYKTPHHFGHRDFVLVDEAHMINPKGAGMYNDFLGGLRKINPYIRTIGLTATDFRQGQGRLTDEGGMFSHVTYNLSTIEGFARLIAEGYLCPLVPRPTEVTLDVSGVKSGANGDYVETQLQAAVDKPEITNAALTEAMRYAHDRRKWIVFASGTDHADHITDWLNAHGVPTMAIHSKKSVKHNDEAFKLHKSGAIRCIVGMNQFTTGYDDPEIDFIIMLRPTKSTSLWVQMLGRGTRPSPGKFYCLCLDFAKNAPRLGPINDPVLPRRKGQGTGEAPVKICEGCGNYNHSSARYCVWCGEAFHFKVDIVTTPSEAPLMRDATPIIQTFEVRSVHYSKWQSRNKPLPQLLVEYDLVGRSKFKEYVGIEASPGAGARYYATEWWMERHASPCPTTVDEALKLMLELRCPSRVTIHVNADFPRIVDKEYG